MKTQAHDFLDENFLMVNSMSPEAYDLTVNANYTKETFLVNRKNNSSRE